MSGKGHGSFDATAEIFFEMLKAELVSRTVFRRRAEAIAEIDRYIAGLEIPFDDLQL